MKHQVILALLLSVSLAAANAGETTALDHGISLWEARELDAAIEILEQAAAKESAGGQAHYYTGRAWFDKGHFKEAAGWLEKAVEMDPGNAVYHQWLGRAYANWASDANIFRKMSLAGDIRREAQKAVELAPDNIEMRNDLITFYLQAPGVAGGSTDKALEQAKKIQTLDAVQGHFAFGRIYEKKEQNEKAEAEYRSAIKLAPGEASSYYRLAYLCQRRDDFDGAHETFTALAEAKPDEMGALYQIGRNGALSGRHLEPAAKSLERYIAEYTPGENQPSLAWAHVRLGQVYGHMGDGTRARGEFEAALVLDPTHKEAKKALKALN
jgi:tetratricopeptide (TPR) repeat protein